jgi:NOL1/NOP2/fmu family ribosome biogenesis protein
MKSKPKFIELEILNKEERKSLIKNLNEQFGITELPGIILKRGKERLFFYEGNLNEKQIKDIEAEIPVERVGLYFAKIVEDRRNGDIGIKLSIEGVQILQKQLTKNIYEITDEKYAEKWMMGQDLDIQTGLRGFIIIKYKKDFLGCGKASENKIGNFIPKTRRLKDKNVI